VICLNQFFDQTITNDSLKQLVDKAIKLYGAKVFKVEANLERLVIVVNNTTEYKFSELL